MDQGSHTLSTGSGTEQGPSSSSWLQERPGKQLVRPGGRGRLTEAGLPRAFLTAPCAGFCSASARRDYTLHSAYLIRYRGVNHGLREPGWLWIYHCWLKLSGGCRGVDTMILSTFVYVWERCVIKKIFKTVDSGVKVSRAEKFPRTRFLAVLPGANDLNFLSLCFLISMMEILSV